ncbi:HD family phosphohydrolase [Flavicella sediminum]|uniref:HD family phosphohydrolase n=1 Tax=Flavicella sediminum TaxID=2585141 RepID=UPI00111EE5A8|nr:HDIG domain-containing metalloprotein [Flavicella sediminum]
MKDILNKIYQNNSIIYKIFLFVVTTFLIVYLFPKGGKFKYEFQKGKPWQYESLYSPFDFAIQKSAELIASEKEEILKRSKLYFATNLTVKSEVAKSMENRFQQLASDSLYYHVLVSEGNKILNTIYKNGFLDPDSESRVSNRNTKVVLRRGNEINEVFFKDLVLTKDLLGLLQQEISAGSSVVYKDMLINVLTDVVRPNVTFDTELTEKALRDELNAISYTTGRIAAQQIIISRGDIVEGKKLAILHSLKQEYKSQIWSKSNYSWIVFGYTILVALALLMLLLFLRKDRIEIFDDNTKVTFIFFNIILMILLVTFTIKYRVDYLYVVPLSLLPIILKAFFDARLGLFTHVLTVLLLGFVVPNSFEFIYLQIIAGIVTILTVSELYKRANLFISVGQITLIYMLTYFAFSIIHEGNIGQINWNYFVLFALNGVLSFLSLFLIWLYEKLFGLVSDVTLLELSNTNSKLLRELNERAPGTFQHSMQVANLAEAAANEIGANSMLVRTGALYHDIGKIVNPMYFTENQSTSVNPHDELPPKDSAGIIIDHVINGIELAKKNGLPDRIIDFIRTHHGTSTVYFFYKKAEQGNLEGVDQSDYQYPGPIPFSKETAILMMSDAAEAASKSLKNPTAQSIDTLIDKITSKQMEEGQFRNAAITFREIETIKKVLKKKLKNIYHLRIEYPE